MDDAELYSDAGIHHFRTYIKVSVEDWFRHLWRHLPFSLLDGLVGAAICVPGCVELEGLKIQIELPIVFCYDRKAGKQVQGHWQLSSQRLPGQWQNSALFPGLPIYMEGNYSAQLLPKSARLSLNLHSYQIALKNLLGLYTFVSNQGKYTKMNMNRFLWRFIFLWCYPTSQVRIAFIFSIQQTTKTFIKK